MFGCYIIYLLWEAMIITYLTTRVITLPFFDLKSLLETSSYKIGLGPGTSSVNNFKVSLVFSTLYIWTSMKIF